MGMDAGVIALTDAAVEHSPSAPGVYRLYRGDQLTYIGLAEQGDGISQSLENHRSGACAGCSQQATAFTYELSHHPRRRYTGSGPDCTCHSAYHPSTHASTAETATKLLPMPYSINATSSSPFSRSNRIPASDASM